MRTEYGVREAKDTNYLQKKGGQPTILNADDTSSKRRDEKYLLDFAHRSHWLYKSEHIQRNGWAESHLGWVQN